MKENKIHDKYVCVCGGGVLVQVHARIFDENEQQTPFYLTTPVNYCVYIAMILDE